MFNKSIELYLAGEEQGCNIIFKNKYYFAMFALKDSGKDALDNIESASIINIDLVSDFIQSSFKSFHKNKKKPRYITDVIYNNKLYSFIVFFQEKFNTVVIDEQKIYKSDKSIKILDFIKASGLNGRTLSEIVLHDKSIPKTDRNKILKDMVDSGLLLENKIGESKKKIKMYFWKEFFNE